MHFHLKKTSGFTLVEMVIATTIFAIMSVLVLSIYIQTMNMSTRIKATRYLSESAREITERIAEDVRVKGLSGTVTIPGYAYWDGTNGYTTGGSEILGIGDGDDYYLYGRKDPSVGTINKCDGTDKTSKKIHCGLYLVKGSDFAGSYNLIDSFIPEEDKKRVKLEDIKFYISGDGETTEKKVTIVFTLALMPRIGVPNMELSESRLKVQTTISERYFKQN